MASTHPRTASVSLKMSRKLSERHRRAEDPREQAEVPALNHPVPERSLRHSTPIVQLGRARIECGADLQPRLGGYRVADPEGRSHRVTRTAPLTYRPGRLNPASRYRGRERNGSGDPPPYGVRRGQTA